MFRYLNLILMRSIMSIISPVAERSEIAARIANFFLLYGQLILALFILVTLFFYYDIFIQGEIAKFLETADFRPPTIVR